MINQCLIKQMSSESKANNISTTTPTVVKSTIDSSEKSKKSTMTSSAKEFIPKQKLSIDQSINTFKNEIIDILPDEQKQAGDYLYSDAGYESQFSCGNINECTINDNENCLSGDLYVANCNQTTPIRPNSLNMNSSNLCESNVYQTVTLQNPPIYTMDPNINSYYSCIAANQETINSVNYMANPVITTASPVIVQHSSTQNLNLFQQFHNSGGSSPHSYQSVSPPILNNSTFTVPNTNNVSNTSMGGEHYVMVHVNLGETFSIRVGDQIQNISGPATVRMVSNSGPPTPMPMQVPPGHMVQQIVDENGILTHVILSPLHQPTQCLGPHVQHVHSSNPQSQFYTANQTNPTIPIYTNNYPLYTNGTNISQSINVNNHHISNGQGSSSITTNNDNSRPNNGFQNSAEKSTNSRLDRVSKDRSQTATDYSSNSQSNNRFSDSKLRPLKHRTHQYHHSSQMDEPSTYYPKNVSPSTDFTYNHDKPTNNSSLSPFSRDDAIHDPYNSGYTTSHSHYSKYRKKRQYSNSASANPKHHFMPDTNISPNSSADEVGTILTDEEKKAITDVLNTIDKPEVSEIEARSALIHIISPPIPDNCVATINSLEFQLHFAERNPESRYNCVFYGQAVEISLRDLKPATDYYVKVCAFYENITGNMSAANKFTTLSAEPNQPKPVQVQSKTRNSLQVKWNAPIENGSRITEFVLEYCRVDCNIDNYMEAYRGNAKTYKITKLKPSTEYLIRLSAINILGQSPWSEALSVLTSGTAPLPPDPPSLARADIGGLLLTWRKRPTDETFCLEMMDEATGYGFITVFNGPEIEHYVENLRRNTSYRFHLAASNQDGRSKWSDVVTHSTKPDLPSPPQKLHVRGKVHSTHFVLVWNEPEDDGGLPVTSYKLELDVNSVFDNQNKNSDPFDNESDRDWVIFHEGMEREYQCKNLTPGNVVLARVSAKSSVGGWGLPCNPITINLAAMPPSQMLPPRKDLGNKSKGGLAAGSINLSWEKPEIDGGSIITNYELCQWLLRSKSKVTSTDSPSTNVVIEEYFEETEEQVVYSGSQLYCQISGLIPGALYRYRIRATNKAGNGKWSNSMDATSGHGAPEAPSEAPTVLFKSAHSAIVSWKAPHQANGAKITEYRLESKLKSDNVSDFQLIYCGPQLSYNVKNLLPDTCYRYRVQAVNRTGVSIFSPICDVTTPASVPGQIVNLRTGNINMQSIQLLWKEPSSHGSPILNYNIEVTCCNSIQLPIVANSYNSSSHDPFILLSESTDKIVTDLLPDTIYKFRVQAVNGVGSGPFCQTIKSSTLSPPPSPPRLECLNIQSNSIKLRWHNDISARQYYINRIMGLSQTMDKTASNNSTDLTITQYQLQMSRQSDSGWSTVYTGTLQFHKLGKLLESTVYYFRIMASNEIGDGDFSDPFKVVTEKAAPPVVRAPKVSDITPESCFIEWSALRSMNQDPIVYILQLLTISEKDCDYRQLWKNGNEVYRGSDTSCHISSLLPGTEYVTRVCAVRLCSPSTITKERDEDSPAIGRRNDQETDKSIIRPKGNSSPVTELLGPFSKSVPFTTFTSNNQRLNYGSITGSGMANLSLSEKQQLNAGLGRHSSKLFQLPAWFTHFRDSIGPLTDTHLIVLLLVIFSIIVIFIANIIQTYLK